MVARLGCGWEADAAAAYVGAGRGVRAAARGRALAGAGESKAVTRGVEGMARRVLVTRGGACHFTSCAPDRKPPNGFVFGCAIFGHKRTIFA
jgi:hypothetical protein